MVFVFESARDVTSIDPDGQKEVFGDCTSLDDIFTGNLRETRMHARTHVCARNGSLFAALTHLLK